MYLHTIKIYHDPLNDLIREENKGKFVYIVELIKKQVDLI